MPEPYECPPDHKHDKKKTCYTSHGCRCAPCRDLHRRAQAQYRANRDRTSKLCPVTHRHGETVSCYYNHGCRCLPCRLANSRGATDPLVSTEGARRKIASLMALGWSQRKIADAVEREQSWVGFIMRRDAVQSVTLRLVDTVYDRLSMTPPTAATPHEKAMVGRAQRAGARHGGLPPLAWEDIDAGIRADDVPRSPDDVDDVAVAEAIDRGDVKLTRAERHEAVKVLHARRWSDPYIAAWLGISAMTVLRDRQYLELEGWRDDPNDDGGAVPIPAWLAARAAA